MVALSPDGQAAALSAEAQRIDERIRSSNARVFAAVSVGAPALAFVLVQVPQIKDELSQSIAFLAIPYVFAVLFAFMVLELGQAVYLAYHLRQISERLTLLTEFTPDFRSEYGFAHVVSSLRTGGLRLRVVWFLALTGVVIAYTGLVFWSTWNLWNNSLIEDFLVPPIAASNVILGLLILFGWYHAALGGRDSFADVIALKEAPPLSHSKGVGRQQFWTELAMYVALPRLGDLLAKSTAFATGILAAILFVDESASSWRHYLGYIVAAYVGLEVLINQGKYIWNDLRDREVDVAARGKQRLRFPTRFHRVHGAMPVLALCSVIRIGIGLYVMGVLALLLDSWLIILACFGLLYLQMLYEVHGKFRSLLRIVETVPAYVLRAVVAFEVTRLSVFPNSSGSWGDLGMVGVWVAALVACSLVGWQIADVHHEIDENARRLGVGSVAQMVGKRRAGLAPFFSSGATWAVRLLAVGTVVVSGLTGTRLQSSGVWSSKVFVGVGGMAVFVLVSSFFDLSRRRRLRKAISAGRLPGESLPRREVTSLFVQPLSLLGGLAGALFIHFEGPEEGGAWLSLATALAAVGVAYPALHGGYEQLAFDLKFPRPDLLVAALVNDFFHLRGTRVYVNKQPRVVTRDELSFEEIVRLGYRHPPSELSSDYWVTRRRPHGRPADILPGEKVPISNGARFSVGRCAAKRPPRAGGGRRGV